jgi:hypothetical protein
MTFIASLFSFQVIFLFSNLVIKLMLLNAENSKIRDLNSYYFHRLAKIKSSTKFITSLQDGDTVITSQEQISEHVVNYYNNLFCTNTVLQDSLLAEEVIPNLVNDDINALLTVLPSYSEIKAAVFALNKDSAPGPNGFGAFFFQNYWDIVKNDVTNVVLQLFSSSWILP